MAFVVDEKPHDTFRRDGNDLVMTAVGGAAAGTVGAARLRLLGGTLQVASHPALSTPLTAASLDAPPRPRSA
jgi:fructose-1,6-bisphosphatase/sedoheptulose 1,7-bisphosphatase-like protein